MADFAHLSRALLAHSAQVMRKSHALARTALFSSALGIAACQGQTTAQVPVLPPYQQQLAAQANQQASSSLSRLPPNTQLAAVQTGTRTDVPSGILQPGTILLRRTHEVEKPIPPEQLAQTVQRIAAQTAAAAVQAEAPQILAAADARITSVASTLKSYTDESKRQLALRTAEELEAQQAALAEAEARLARKTEQELQAQQAALADAEARLSNLAENTDIKLGALKDYTRQGAELAELKATKSAENTARQVASVAEERARTLVVDELTHRQRQTDTRLAALEENLETRTEAGRQYARAEVLASQLQTERQMAELKAAQAELTQQATAAVAASLKIYADNQIASLQAETARSIEATARLSQLQADSLTNQTALRLAQYRAEAQQRTEQATTEMTENFNRQLAQSEDKALKPQQVLELARTAVADATPQLRAIALQSLADSQDYIRTIAQESLTDEADPKVQEALEKAAKSVITKDDQVVFAIRQALVTPVAPNAAQPVRTVLGDAHDKFPTPDSYGADIAINPAALMVAPIGGAGVEPAGGVEEPPTHLASLNPSTASMGNPRYRQDWVDLRKYRVVLHEDSRTLESILEKLMDEAEPYVGPWTLKWKISRENSDILAERFSLDAETTFADFVTYISQYILNERGVKLSFNLFDAERILVISD